MPDVRMPDGTIIKNVPDGITQSQLLSRLGASGYDTKLLLQPQKEKAGLFGSFLENAQTLGLGDEAAAFAKNPTEANRRAFLKAGESKFRQVGFGEGDNWEALKQLIGGSAGQLVAPIAAGLAGSAVTTPIGGLVAAGTTSEAQYTIQNLLRQAQEQEAAAGRGEKPQAVSVGKALAAATGQTALDLVGGKVFKPIAKAFPFMEPLLGKAGGKLAENAGAVLADAAEKGTIKFAKGVATGIGKGIAFEIPQEVAQQALERWNAGLSLSDEDAQSEYGQAAIGALVLGGGLGGISGGLKARGAIKEQQVKAALEAAVKPTEEPSGLRAFQNQVTNQLSQVAGPDLSQSGKNAVDALGRLVSSTIQEGTPESLAYADNYLTGIEDQIASGTELGPDIAEPLMRPVLNPDGTPAVDEEGKPVYEGALIEAKRMVREARANLPPIEEAAPEGLTPQAYVDRYMAGEGRGDTPVDLEMQQYAANNAAEIEAEFARRTQEEAARGPSGEPTAPVDAGVGTRVPTDREPVPAGAAAPELGGVEPRPVGVSEPAAPDVTVGANEEPNTLTPAPKMEIASEPLLKYMDRYGQAEYLDNWAKSVLGTEVPSELETAPLLERATTMQAGEERLLARNYTDPLVEAIGKEGVNLGDFDFFQLLDHAAERNREVAKINPQFPEGGSSVTTAQAQEGLREIEKDGLMPKYKKLQAKVQELVRHNLQEDVKAGLRSQEDMDRLLTTYKSWVPLKGWAVDGDMLTADIDEDAHSPARREEAMRALRAAAPSGSIQENRRAWGRGSMPFSPTANLIHDSERRVRRRILNMARLPILRAWKKDPGAFSGMFSVYSETNPKKVAKGRNIGGEKYEAMSMQELMQDHYANPGKYMVVKDNGVPYFIEFNSSPEGQALQRMFANMTPEDMKGAMKTAADINNFLKGMATYKNPLYLAFMAPFRDFSSAIATAMYHQNLKGSPAYKKNLAARTAFYGLPLTGTWSTIAKFAFTGKAMDTKTGKLLEEMIRAGGAPLHTRFMNAQERATTADRAIRRMQGAGNLSAKERGAVLFEGLNKWIDALADMMDLSARFATYRAATDYGIQPADAARLALDSSLNLTRRGEKARKLDLIFPFFGAGVEATRKTKRIFTSKGGAKVAGALIVYGALESLWNAAHSGDDDNDNKADYLNLDQGAGLRLTRLTLYYGNGPDDYVKVPIDPMVGFFKFLGNRMGDVMAGAATPSEATGGIITGAANVISPVRIPNASAEAAFTAFIPMLGKPIVENLFNQNAFGSPIYQESQFDNAPPSELGRPGTGEGWKWLARTVNEATGGSEAVRSKLGLSAQPEVYRHMVESYLGGPYQLAKQFAGLPEAEGVADVPGIKSFKGTGSEYAPQTQYFENSETIRQIMNRLNKLTPEQQAEQGAKYFMDTDPRIIDAYKIVDKQLDKVNKEQRGVLEYMRNNPNEFSSGDEKLVLDHYRAEKNELYSAFNYVYNNVKKGQ